MFLSFLSFFFLVFLVLRSCFFILFLHLDQVFESLFFCFCCSYDFCFYCFCFESFFFYYCFHFYSIYFLICSCFLCLLIFFFQGNFLLLWCDSHHSLNICASSVCHPFHTPSKHVLFQHILNIFLFHFSWDIHVPIGYLVYNNTDIVGLFFLFSIFLNSIFISGQLCFGNIL